MNTAALLQFLYLMWKQFQNHRNRAKKEGKVLRKLTTNASPVHLSIESLEEKMPFFVIPEHERKSHVLVDASDSQSGDDLEDELPVSVSCTVDIIKSQSLLAAIGTSLRARFANRIRSQHALARVPYDLPPFIQLRSISMQDRKTQFSCTYMDALARYHTSCEIGSRF